MIMLRLSLGHGDDIFIGSGVWDGVWVDWFLVGLFLHAWLADWVCLSLQDSKDKELHCCVKCQST